MFTLNGKKLICILITFDPFNLLHLERVPKKTTKVWTYAELHKTGIHGIQDTRQIVDSKTNDKENNDKKSGSDFLT